MKIQTNQNVDAAVRLGTSWCRSLCLGLIALSLLANDALAQDAPSTGGMFTHEGESYRVVDASSYLAGGQTPGAIAQVSGASCDSCGPACGGSCGNGKCSSGGGLFGLGLLDDRIFNLQDDGCTYGCIDPCGSCEPHWYGSVEVLYMDLEGGDSRDLADVFKDGFELEPGGRFTFGYIRDCVHGCEISYTGNMQWDSRATITDPAFGINTLLTVEAPLVAADISAFNNADLQSERYDAQYWSLEIDRTAFAGEMAKVLYGLRYIDYDEKFFYFSQNAAETGFVRTRSDNDLIGVQFGLDLLYPVCRRGYTDFRVRFAGFINSFETRFQLVNDGSNVVTNFSDETDLSGLIELGGGFRYRLGNWSLFTRGELWYFTNIADATGSFQRSGSGTGVPVLRVTTGRAVDPNDFFMAGFSVGAQLTY